MTKSQVQTASDFSHRRFLQATSLGIAGAAALADIPFVHAAETGDMEIKIGLIGCGGRGTGAVLDAIGAATKVIYPDRGYHTEDVAEGATAEKKNIKIVALADLFEDRLARCRGELAKLGITVPSERCFVGFDAYKELLAVAEVNYGGQIWVIERQPGWSDLEWQLRNWNYFTWLSGDHIIEQHVHNLNVMNWVLGHTPSRPSPGWAAARSASATSTGTSSITLRSNSSTPTA